ncbi:MAG: hypothetical protein RIA69_10680 [Cyclobacteriaceae bacterium]
MLLLRNIRRKLISTENKFITYLLYAIGEVILVVVGILIAVNIDDWKNESQNRKLEDKILREISSNLSLDKEGIQEDIDLMKFMSRNCDSLLTYLNRYDEPPEVMKEIGVVLRGTPHFNPNLNGYKLLETKGVDILINDELRNEISSLYEIWYTYYAKYENERVNYVLNIVKPKLVDYFNMSLNPDYYMKSEYNISSDDFRKMKSDEYFKKLIKAVKYENQLVLLRATQLQDEISGLETSIAKELEMRNN